MSRKKNETDKEYYERRHKEYEKYKEKEIKNRLANGAELGYNNVQISNYWKKKILSGETQVLIVDGKMIPFRKKTNGYWYNNSWRGTTVYLHREKMRIYLKLTEQQMEGYEVHHIDGNKDNNDISNLQLLSRWEHQKLHQDTNKWTEKQWEEARARMSYANKCRWEQVKADLQKKEV